MRRLRYISICMTIDKCKHIKYNTSIMELKHIRSGEIPEQDIFGIGMTAGENEVVRKVVMNALAGQPEADEPLTKSELYGSINLLSESIPYEQLDMMLPRSQVSALAGLLLRSPAERNPFFVRFDSHLIAEQIKEQMRASDIDREVAASVAQMPDYIPSEFSV